MKLDKETVVKHQFWFLLGGYLLVWLIAVMWLKFAAAGPIKDVRDKFDSTKKNLETAKQSPVNTRTFLPPWEAYRNTFEGHKQVIWNDAWKLQVGMYDWPFNKDMSTPQTELIPSEREDFKRSLYPDQVKTLRDWAPKLLSPVEMAGGFDALFKPQEWKEVPTREECWLAQEDYWVKRELLYVVSGAVAAQSFMWPIAIDDKKEPMPEGVLYRFRYRNQNWEITFHIKRNKDKFPVIAGDSTIRNIHPSGHPQSLTSAKGAGIVFNVTQGRVVQPVEIKGEPVPWDETQNFSKNDYKPLEGIDWSKTKEQPIHVSQAFDWPTCPIRRIEAIALGQQSCRTFTTALQANDTLVKLDAPAEGTADADANKDKDANASPSGAPGIPGGGAGMMGMAGGPPPGSGAGMMGMMMGGPGMKGGDMQATQNPTPNNAIERNRYLQAPKTGDEAEKPSRHLPLAIQLIVEQSHMHDVLVALANSRLRIQITQVDFQRVQGVRPESGDDKGDDPLRSGAVFMPPGMMGGAGMMMGGAGGTMRPPSGAMPMMPRPGMPSIGPGSGAMMPPGMMGGAGRPMTGGAGRPPMMMGPGSGAMTPPMMTGGGKLPPGMSSTMGMMMYSQRDRRRDKLQPSAPGELDSNRTLRTGESKTAAPSQDEENLVEMTVYGIATLYRRPDPPKTDEQQTGTPGQPAQPGQPAAPTSPAPTPAAPAAPTPTPPAPGKA
jgi:hypothetical protein